MNKKENIRLLSLEEIKAQTIQLGEKAFRAKQLWEWLWKRNALSFEEMDTLPKAFRESLAEKFDLLPLKVKTQQVSTDRTVKTAFNLHDGFTVEGVLIPTAKRMTACISTQVGCSLTCKFCATGKLKRERNIQFDEIFDQVAYIKNQAETLYKKPLTNIVYMGMGEPLLNYSNTLKSIERITAPDGLAMSPRRITVSTAGIAKMIKQLGDDDVKFNLALSLHAPTDEKRSQIMPINEQNSLSSLVEALKYFHEKTGTHVTLEYIIFKDFNDSLEDARNLAIFSKNFPCKINIIEYNAVEDTGFERCPDDVVTVFKDYLESKNVTVSIRRSRGRDIDAACGQLANKHEKK